jgi:hypothetical protein
MEGWRWITFAITRHEAIALFEYCIIEDSLSGMPFNAWNLRGKGQCTIQVEVY